MAIWSSTFVKEENASPSPEKMAFHRGQRVEISSNEEGFVGSYYAATIITRLSDEDYIVQYRTLLTDAGYGPLREVVSVDQIQPLPDVIPATAYSIGDVVDAYDNDGWWVGKISAIIGSNYFVYFERTNEENAYPFDLLRIHQGSRIG